MVVELVLLLAAAAAVGVAAIYVYLLTAAFLVDWFRSHRDLLRKRARVAVSFKKAKRDGRVTYIQGVLNEDTEEFDDVREIEADEVEDKVKRMHQGNKIAIWS